MKPNRSDAQYRKLSWDLLEGFLVNIDLFYLYQNATSDEAPTPIEKFIRRMAPYYALRSQMLGVPTDNLPIWVFFSDKMHQDYHELFEEKARYTSQLAKEQRFIFAQYRTSPDPEKRTLTPENLNTIFNKANTNTFIQNNQ